MNQPHTTDQFAVTETGEIMELWVDWVPAVDGNPCALRKARFEGDVLVVEVAQGDEAQNKPRHVVGLKPDIIEDIRSGFTWYIAGPSGVLAEHRLVPEA